MKKKKAFTLAEVLIVLAIIGVVAALTMPMLMNNYQKTQQVVALKKVYSQISDAIDRVMIDSDSEKFTEVTILNGDDADPKAFLKQYFRVSKYCELKDFAKCFPEVTSIDKGSTGNPAYGNMTCIIAKDGASICVRPSGGTLGYGSAPAMFVVDTNGPNKPNVAGRDVFTFSVYWDGSVDEIDPNQREANGATARSGRIDQCEVNMYGAGCLSKIIDDGWKMDY